MNDNTRALVEYLRNTGTGQTKLDCIAAIIAERPDIGAVELVDLMANHEDIPSGTLSKARRWLADPTLTAPTLVKRTQAELIAEHSKSLAAHYGPRGS